MPWIYLPGSLDTDAMDVAFADRWHGGWGLMVVWIRIDSGGYVDAWRGRLFACEFGSAVACFISYEFDVWLLEEKRRNS